MRINEMNPQEKSALLTKAMGWRYGVVGDDAIGGPAWVTLRDSSEELIWRDIFTVAPLLENYPRVNLYYPANMALAKRAIEWGAANIPEFKKTLNLIGSNMWILPGGVTELLDEILSMLIEAGLVEVNDV